MKITTQVSLDLRLQRRLERQLECYWPLKRENTLKPKLKTEHKIG